MTLKSYDGVLAEDMAEMQQQVDFIVIGGGIAGVSVGYELSKSAKVLILEREEHPGQHSTGRSAAVFAASHGSSQPALYALSEASAPFFENPPIGFSEHPLINPRGVLFIAHEDKLEGLRQKYEQMQLVNKNLQLLDQDAIQKRMPALRPEYTRAAIYEERVYDLDVHGLQEGYLKGFRNNGGTLALKRSVDQMEYADGIWTVTSGEHRYFAPVVINAAGAWADQIARLAGTKPLSLQPLRRTAILVDPPAGKSPDNWPMTVEFEEQFYIKPDAGKLMVSPADETPSQPSDSQPEEIDVAYAAHYAETALDMEVTKVDHSWSGLRNFVADRNPVVGYAADAPGFFWLAGQGGYGIQTSPAAARLAASLALRRGVPEDIAGLGLKESEVSPARLGVETHVA
ncbi:NAD(P)/FAD-dependent oxidoreductase [Pseudomaricurvus alkylphenolicus]|uniref:NAD(P)/FAD-dependent oxidoreductase n=1 Tax=Pseudomaricurvus alkylphenolicus TaxID=1306991 RepID=UPI00197F8B48|nr:FAD-dependent oxidoreductase [Pseudomaricurvus alkylphenolicus]